MQIIARQAHNLEVARSNPASATIRNSHISQSFFIPLSHAASSPGGAHKKNPATTHESHCRKIKMY